MLDDRDPDAVRWRRALIEELVAAPSSPALRAIAGPALRALVRESAERHIVDADLLRRRLLELADDPALRADQRCSSHPAARRAAPRPADQLMRGSRFSGNPARRPGAGLTTARSARRR
jgi:hypothetical protein